MSDVRRLGVDASEAGERLDRFLVRRLGELGRKRARRIIAAGWVRVDGRPAVAGQALSAGQRVDIVADALLSDAPAAEPDAALLVVHEDPYLVIVDKPAGQATHPLRPGECGTLASALVARYPEMTSVGYSPREPGLLHRLDIDTSGLLLCARDQESFAALCTQLREHAIDKRYLALVAGRMRAPAVLRGWLRARGPRVQVRAREFRGAHPVTTEVLESSPAGPDRALSLVELRVAHAARHQIRAHLAAEGHPIVGDRLYEGPALPGLDRHFLHASGLSFAHPRYDSTLRLSSPLPPDLLRHR